MTTAEKRTKSDRVEPRQISVPDVIMAELDRLVELVSARLGESPEQVRRGVEVSVLARGIERIKSEEGLR